MNADASLCITKTTPAYTLCCRRKQLVDKSVLTHGRWPDCDALPQLIGGASTPGVRKLFVDVGSNIGACSMLMAAHGHRVIAFEPVPQTFRALAAGFAANEFAPGAQVTLVNAAASTRAGAATIMTQHGNAGNSFTTGARAGTATNSSTIRRGFVSFEIETVKLDDIVHERVDLMKIDTQGHELKALQGAARLLSIHGIRTIAFEFWPPKMDEVGSSPIEFLNFLTQRGYAIRLMNGTALQPSEFESFTALVRSGRHEQVAKSWRQTWTDLVAVATHLPAGAE